MKRELERHTHKLLQQQQQLLLLFSLRLLLILYTCLACKCVCVCKRACLYFCLFFARLALFHSRGGRILSLVVSHERGEFCLFIFMFFGMLLLRLLWTDAAMGITMRFVRTAVSVTSISCIKNYWGISITKKLLWELWKQDIFYTYNFRTISLKKK